MSTESAQDQKPELTPEQAKATIDAARLAAARRLVEQVESLRTLFTWASPLLGQGQVEIIDNVISLGMGVAKRFLVGADLEAAILMAQAPEMAWIRAIPLSYAGVDNGTGRIFLSVMPEAPLRQVFITMAVDRKEKIAPWFRHTRLRITEFNPAKMLTMKPPRQKDTDVLLPLRHIHRSMHSNINVLRPKAF